MRGKPSVKQGGLRVNIAAAKFYTKSILTPQLQIATVAFAL
jgi:hypothetical protein